ncbi:ABC transporter ATP-binding protein [Lactiplantibacillus plantarum]|uniref:ABC transporter ATP-binding protein n=1 Tax=Lactiplantibacillus plantarum TaxID=1590 RepID=UPI0007BB06F0|nr:ABC transporter ATP-binding protein [Lactiplantibacillus plantarum]KZU84948.1 Multidrug resistance ABC transporterATP-binding and permease protein [Lactiplantibacillus plantarum]
MIKQTRSAIFHLNYFFILGISLTLLSSLAGILVPLIIRKMIDSESNLTTNVSTNNIFLLICLLIAQTSFNAVGEFLISREGERQVADTRYNLQKHLIYLPLSFFNEHYSGQLSSRVINDTNIIKDFITVTLPESITGIFTVISSISILFYLDWRLSAILLSLFPIDLLIMSPIGKFEKKITRKTQKETSDLSLLVTEEIQNIRFIKINAAEQSVSTSLKNKIRNILNLNIKSDFFLTITNPIQNFLALTLMLSIILYGGVRLKNGSLSVGTLTSFILFFFQLFAPASSLATSYADYTKFQGATEKIKKIMGTPLEFHPLPKASANKIYTQPTIYLQNISFSYKKRTILKNINMTFPPNTKIAIVGPSGVGKTTLINLLLRLYTVNSGDIFINGVTASSIPLDAWRSFFSVVSQDNTIMTGTLYENLIFGLQYMPTAQEISKALEASNLSHDVHQMSDGLNTHLSEHGTNLSGGQRQRLQIAQAYLRHSKFFILDEATANLDPDSENTISKMIDMVKENSSVITIAHRLSTITNADKIYFLNNKEIAGAGTHSELLKTLPAYRRYVDEQFISKSPN